MKAHEGFTLIEVLIAMAILAIALTAIIKSTSQNIQDTVYLQNKVLANWVAMDIMNEARAGLVKLPLSPDAFQTEKEMLGQPWPCDASRFPTPNPRIFKIIVTVFQNANHAKMATLVGYTYAG